MTRYAFYFDSTRCVGCKTCQVACRMKNGLTKGQFFRHVNSFEAGEYPTAGMYHLSMGCNHCAKPECVRVCPVGAMYVAEDGTVQHDDDLCIGCQACVKGCPFGAPQYCEDLTIVRKCNACADTRGEDGTPTCVAACSMRALEFGDYDELLAAHPEAAEKIAPMPEAITCPSILIGARPYAFDEGYRQRYL